MEEGARRSALGAGRKTRARDLRDLSVWRKGREIAAAIYDATRSFPPEETFGINIQMRRSAISIPSNIAEGFNRRGSREFQRFVSVALGSCGELRSLVVIAQDLRLLAATIANELEEKVIQEERMPGSLQRSLVARRRSPNADRPAPSAQRPAPSAQRPAPGS
jgi:four helix bundle protein